MNGCTMISCHIWKGNRKQGWGISQQQIFLISVPSVWCLVSAGTYNDYCYYNDGDIHKFVLMSVQGIFPDFHGVPAI